MIEASETASSERSEALQTRDKSIERLTELLDSEIVHIRSEYERPGWTRWALLGGIASTIWLIMDRVELSSFNVTNVSILFLAFSLLFYLFISLSTLLDSPRAGSRTGDRFRLTNRWFALSRSGILLFLAHIVVVIVTAYSVQAYVLWPFTVTIYVVYGLLALVLLLLFTLTYFPYPFSVRPGSPITSTMFNLVLIVGSLAPAVAYLHSVINSPNAANIDDFRIAALFIVLYYLSRTLVGLRGKTPILSSLVTTRRELLLGRIDIDIATQQIDIALAGLRVSDILHEDVRELLELRGAYSAEMCKASKKTKAMRATIKDITKSGEKPDEQDLSIVESLADSIQSHVQKGSEIQDEIDQRLQRFDRKVIFLAHSSREAGPAITEVLDQINAAAKEARHRFGEFVKESETLMKFADETLGGATLDDAGHTQLVT
jgi:hypothetical protein